MECICAVWITGWMSVVFVVPTGATVLCHTQDGRVKDNIPIAQWAVTSRSLGELESNFGNLDILLCTKTSHTENCAAHILSHQKTRNSVNTSTAPTAAVREKLRVKEQTCRLCWQKMLKCSYLPKGDKETFPAPSSCQHKSDKCCKEREGEWGSYSSKARHNIVNNLKTGPIESGITPDPSSF